MNNHQLSGTRRHHPLNARDCASGPMICWHWFMSSIYFHLCQGLSYTHLPSWKDLESTHITPVASPPVYIDCFLEHKKGQQDFIDRTSTNVRLFRERNGWCIYSARLWLALEVKGIPYDTVLVEARGDAYGGSENLSGGSDTNDDGRPEFLGALSLPLIQYQNDELLHHASDEVTSLEVLKQLDLKFPESSTPLFNFSEGKSANQPQNDDIVAIAETYGQSVLT